MLSKKKVAWLIDAPIQGSGGFRTIFTSANFLQENGYKCTLFINNKYNGDVIESVYVMRELIKKFFGTTKCEIKLGWKIEGDFDLIFATYWETAKIVRDYVTTAKKAYFIQDFEAYFHYMGDGFILAENTYKYGLIPVTIGRWLSHLMQDDYGVPSNYFDFCADTKIYNNKHQKREEFSVCMIYQPEKPRRCPVIGIEALGILKHMVPEAKIYLYGSNEVGNIWYKHKNLKIISPKQCAKLYNKCSVGLCLSSSNPSRIPFEMMACGLPVVEMYRQNNLYDMPQGGVLLADGRPESLALAIKYLFDNSKIRKSMSTAGSQYMKWKDIEKGYHQFLKVVEEILNGDVQEYKDIKKLYHKKTFTGDLKIFTGANSFKEDNVKQLSRIKKLVRKLVPYELRKNTKTFANVLFFKYQQTKIISNTTHKILPFRVRKKIKSMLVRSNEK